MAAPDPRRLRRVGTLHAARSCRSRRLILSAAVVAAAVACADAQAAAPSPEQQLASRYSPVVALKKQRELCGKGEAYRPVLVDVVLGRADVSLFDGAEGRYRRLRRAPTAADLVAGPFEHYVDLPGHPVTGALQLPALVQAHRRPSAERRVCARREGTWPSRPAGAPVLALLRLQRLQRQARVRLGA